MVHYFEALTKAAAALGQGILPHGTVPNGDLFLDWFIP